MILHSFENCIILRRLRTINVFTMNVFCTSIWYGMYNLPKSCISRVAHWRICMLLLMNHVPALMVTTKHIHHRDINRIWSPRHKHTISCILTQLQKGKMCEYYIVFVDNAPIRERHLYQWEHEIIYYHISMIMSVIQPINKYAPYQLIVLFWFY